MLALAGYPANCYALQVEADSGACLKIFKFYYQAQERENYVTVVQLTPERIILWIDHFGLTRDNFLNLLQTWHSILRLKAVASRLNSARTSARPRSRNLLAPSCSLIIPKVGSLSSLRRAYRLRASSVLIHCRCFRNN